MAGRDLELDRKVFMPGKFEGWNPSKTYKLSDGTKWKLRTAKTTRVKKNNALIKVWRDEEDHYFLQIIGLHDKVAVCQII